MGICQENPERNRWLRYPPSVSGGLNVRGQGREQRSSTRRFTIAVLSLAVVALVLYDLAARHLVGGNSDGATVILEGQSIAHGNLSLAGWTLSFDSFWTIDAVFYAIAIAITGIRPVLLTAVPVVIAVGVLLCSLFMAQRRLGARGRLVAIATVATLLIFPSRGLTSILLQGPLHVGTLLYCLAAFMLLCPARFGIRWGCAVALLAAALLGDLQSLLLAVVPIALGAALAGIRDRSWRSAVPLASAAVVSGLVAVVVREILHAVGGFLAPKANTSASPHQILRNVAHLPGEFLSVLGVTTGPFGPSGVPLLLRLLHLVAVGVVAIGVIYGLAQVLHGLSSRPASFELDPTLLEQILTFGFLADLATLVFLPISNSDAYSRYATAGIVFGAILGARALGRFAERTGAPAMRSAVIGSALIIAGYAGSFAFSVGGPAVAAAPKTVAAFLADHKLVSGVGDYWSSSIVTVDADDDVRVRPVIVGDNGLLVRYTKQSQADWYGSVPFTFYVFNTAYIWNGDDAAVALRTFGRPHARFHVGTYEILTYNHPFTVSQVGSDGP